MGRGWALCVCVWVCVWPGQATGECRNELGPYCMSPPWNRTVDGPNNQLFTPGPAPCPSPMGVLRPSFVGYSRAAPQGRLVYTNMSVVASPEPCHVMVLLVHGYDANGTTEFILRLKDSYLQQFPSPDVHVMVYDWNTLTGPDNYAQAVSNTRAVGRDIARFVTQVRGSCPGVELQCVGHSLGAHVCGYAGKDLRSNGQPAMQLIVGLDPASVGYRRLRQPYRLAKNDARTVVSLVTDANGLGTDECLGDTCIIVNGGDSQPACDGLQGVRRDVCDHLIVVDYWGDSLGNRQAFCGRQMCTTLCETDDPAVDDGDWVSLCGARTTEGACWCLNIGQWCSGAGRVAVNTTVEVECSPTDTMDTTCSLHHNDGECM